MAAETVDAVITHARKTWHFANDIEITLEANPTSVEASRFAGYHDAGVNRVSIGVQSLRDDDLRRLGRLHSKDEALSAIEIARNTFPRMSFDLMYGRQDQTAKDWEAELNEAIGFAADHLSLYQLTVEDGTAFGDRYKAGRLLGLPDDDLSVQLFEITQEICEHNGLPAYEVSNHAPADSESRHNMIYWRYGDYAGIGPGAHGRLTIQGQKIATEAEKLPGKWLSGVSSGMAELPRTVISSSDQAAEYLMMGLRLSEGVDVDRFAAISGMPINQDHIKQLCEDDLMILDENRIKTTRRGRLILNAVIEALLRD